MSSNSSQLEKLHTCLRGKLVPLLACTMILVSPGCATGRQTEITLDAAISTAIEHYSRSAPYFDAAINPMFHEKVMARCITLSDVDKRAFDLVFTLSSDGKVMRSFKGGESQVLDCLVKNLKDFELPRPPFAPYFVHFNIRFHK